MPRNQSQKMVFALLTVIVTVHAYVFYSLYVINGNTFMALTGESSVIAAINAMGGISVLGKPLPIWGIVLIEFVLAYCLELTIGSPLSFRLASRIFDPRKNHPMLFETAIICATVGLMCPIMSFLAAILYYPYYMGFNLFTFLANWLKLVCFNFPFAYLTQLFFIQPLVRVVFKFLYRKDIEKREELAHAREAQGERLKPTDETEAISDVLKRIDEIKKELEAEYAKIDSAQKNKAAM